MLVLGMMAASVEVMGQTTSNLLPDEYTSEGLVTRGYASEGYKGVKWRFYPDALTSNDEVLYFQYLHTLKLQSYSGNSTVELAWSETSYTTQSYDIEAATQRAVMTYYESSDNMISSIATGAFRNFTNLESVELPQNVNGVTIGTNAFYGCENLQTAYNMEYAYIVYPGAFKDTPLRNSIQALPSETRLFSIGSSCNSTLTSGVINGSAFMNTKLSYVHIGNNIATIGQSAFEGCSSMKELTIGDNVTSIGDYAFRGCTGLTSISLGAGFNLNIDIPNVFDTEMNLNTISISDENIAYSDEGNCLVDANDVLWIGTNSSVIPDRVTTIGEKAFYGRTGLTSIVIPAGVTEIGEEAFAYCDNLKMVMCLSEEPFRFKETTFAAIPYDAVLVVPSEAAAAAYEDAGYLDYFGSIAVGESGVVTNGVNWALYSNDNGASYTLEISGKGAMADYEKESAVPWSKYNVGEDIFNKINKVVVKEGITHIGSYCFANLGYYLGVDGAIDVEVSLPYDLKTIAAEAFTYSYGLKSLELPNYVESIGNRAFHGCHNLARIAIDQSGVSVKVYDVKGNCIIANNVVVYGCYTATIPEGVKSIGSHAFAGQKRLKSITIPSSVESIKYLEEEFGAFAYSALESITFAEGSQLKSISPYAFYYCESLKSIDLPNSLTTIGDGAFLECYALESVTLGSSVETIGASAFNCAPISSIIIPASVKSIGNRTFANCRALESMTFAEGSQLTSIGDNAFYSCNALESIAIPNSVTSIGESAFEMCYGLVSATLSNSMETIPNSMFYKCTGLKNITIPESVTSIGDLAFFQCQALTEITIPNSVTSIGAQAFQRCNNIMTVTIGKSVESIGASAVLYLNNSATVTWLPYNMPTLGARVFNPESINNITWRVYYIPNYSSMSDYFTIEAIPITITDGAVDNYEDIFEEDILLSRVEYNRTLLADSRWNALYVPFEIPVADIIDKYDVAYINDVRLYDSNGNNETDENDQMATEVIKVTSGTLHANHPYIIRVKKSLTDEEKAAARAMNLALSTKLCPAEENTYDCSSLYTRYEFAGTYNKLSKEQIMEQCGGNAGLYAIATDGTWHIIKDGSSLKPFRLYLSITNRDGSPYRPNETAAAAIRIRVVGEEDDATGIDNSQFTIDNSQFVYDLQGRRVTHPAKGIYIVGGKKTVIK